MCTLLDDTYVHTLALLSSSNFIYAPFFKKNYLPQTTLKTEPNQIRLKKAKPQKKYEK